MKKRGCKSALKGSLGALVALMLSLAFVSCVNPIVPAKEKSANANLSVITIDASGTDVALSPSFSADVVEYKATVVNSVASVSITATAAESSAVVTGTGAKTLEIGANAVSIAVTAADGTTVKTYAIEITRAAPQASSDASLASLVVGGTTFTAPVAGTTLTAEVGCSATVATITSTPTDAGAIVTVSGNENLVPGDNAVTVMVTAADGVTKATYPINVIRHGLTLTSPAANTAITTASFTLKGAYYGSVAPAITIKFAGLDAVNATVDATAKTWTATIDGSSVFNGEGTTLTVIADWGNADSFRYAGTYTFAGSTVPTVRGVVITSPANREVVSSPVVSVAGYYTGESTPTSISIGLGSTNTAAKINPVTHTWTAEITPVGVAKTNDVNITAVAVWDSGSAVKAYRNFAYTGTEDLGHTVSGTVAFPGRNLTSDTKLFVYTADASVESTISSYNAELTSATTYDYTLTNVADGTYVIRAFTHDGDWAFVSGTSCYEWAALTITVKGSDIVDQDFTIRSPSGDKPQYYKASGTITVPPDVTFDSDSHIAVLLFSTSTTPNVKVDSVNIQITSDREYAYSLFAPTDSYRIESYVNDGKWEWESAEKLCNWNAAVFDIASADRKGIDFYLDDDGTKSVTITTPVANSDVSGTTIAIGGTYSGYYTPVITYELSGSGIVLPITGTAIVDAKTKQWSATIDSSSFKTMTPSLRIVAQWPNGKTESTYENFNFIKME